MSCSSQERQLKSKLDKQLREKEDYILQVLAQKRKVEEQLKVKVKEQVSLQQVRIIVVEDIVKWTTVSSEHYPLKASNSTFTLCYHVPMWLIPSQVLIAN